MANHGDPDNLDSDTIGIPPPKLQNLTSMIASTGVSSAGATVQVWEVGVPKKKSLAWSIVLSYLLLIPCSEHEHQTRLQKLIGSDSYAKKVKKQKNMSPGKIKSKDVRKSLQHFNPFKNRHVSFFNHKLKEVMRIFDIKLKRLAANLLQKNGVWNDSLKLQAASNMLNCSIDVFRPKDWGYFRFDPNGNRSPVRITLFQYENIQLPERINAINIFHFGFEIEQATLLQVEALVFILRKAKILEHEIIEIQRTVNINKFVIFSLLNRPKIYIIPKLYKSPYHVLKLADAGFEWDPTKKDHNGLSMLYYAMTHVDTTILRSLYNFSANSYQFSECTRNRNESIIESLDNLCKVIAEEREKVLNSNSLRFREETYLQTSLEFLRFCEYQRRIAQDIIAERGQSPNHNGSFELRKNIILKILDCYMEFYYYKCNADNTFHEIYWDFVKFNEYYLSLDNFTCSLFFHHAFCLETEIPTILYDCFWQLEQAFFFLAISNAYFKKRKHQLHCNGCTLNFSECEKRNNTMLLLPFLFRSSLRLQVTNFMSKLKESDANYMSSSAGATSDSTGVIPVPNCAVPVNSGASPVSTSTGRSKRRNILFIPEIRDELLISRVKQYIKAAIQVPLKEHKLKGIPVIERALQMMGESLKPSSTEKCIASHLLCSSLPSNLKSSFTKSRNSFFSHCRTYSFAGRQKAEDNLGIFEVIQNELRLIDETFEIVYTVQNLRVEQFLIKQGIEESKKWPSQSDLISTISKEYNNTVSMKLCKLINSKIEFYTLCKNFIDYIGSHVNNSHPESNIKDIRDMFWTLEYLFSLISQQCNEQQATVLRNIALDFNNYLKSVIVSELSEDFKRYITAILETCHSSIDTIFGIISSNSNTIINCSQTEKLFNTIANVYHFTEDEKVTIRGLAANDEAIAAKKELERILEDGEQTKMPDEETLFRKLNIGEADLNNLRNNFWKNKKKKKCFAILNKVQDLSEPVEKMLKDNILEKKDYWSINKRLKLPNALKIKVLHVVNQKLEFLLNRIDLLKNILIDEDDEIRQMWKYGKNDSIKNHSKFLMGQRYRKELDYRAALEMLLSDCLNILISRKDLYELWTKTNSLYAGTSLRDFLSHGHDVLQMIGGFLDPQDLPLELINKMLELIEDSSAIKAMFTLCKEGGAEYIKDIRDELNQKSEITRCPRWEKYLHFMHLK